jgi:RNA polymerase sigma-70 factor (ECF subfamily)
MKPNDDSAGATADELGDEELTDRAIRGDRGAFNVLMNRHRDQLHVICRRITGHEQDAQDALQDALVTAWRQLGTFQGRAKLSTWLYRIATNAAIDERRRRDRRPAPTEAILDRPVPGPSVADRVADRVTLSCALAQLPPRFRAAVVLREYCGMSYREIADVRQLPIDTVKSQLSRARQALVDLLAEPGAPRRPRGRIR